MISKKIYHLFPGNMKHHAPSMIKYFLLYPKELDIDINDHYYILYGQEDMHDSVYRELNIKEGRLIFIKDTSKDLKNFIIGIGNDNSLILHSSFIKHIWFILLINRFNGLKKTAWISWGGDLLAGQGIKGKIYDFIKKICISKMKTISTLDDYDAKFFQENYTAKIINSRAFYSQFDFDWDELIQQSNEHYLKDNKYKILIGNSAWPENDHINIMNKLKKFKDEDIEIYCPLGYPTATQYKDSVIKHGYSLFGEKFKPIENVLAIDDYNKLLDNMNILVFNNLKQQGLYIVYYMLSKGKKIYLNSKGSTYSTLKNWSASVEKTEKINDLSIDDFIAFEPINMEVNINVAKEKISVEASFKGWKKMINIVSG